MTGVCVQLTGVHHVSINVDDLETARRFYCDVLGLSVLPRPELGVAGLWLGLGQHELHLIEVAGYVAPEGPHFAVEVVDLDDVVRTLTGRGARCSATRSLDGGRRQSFCSDPSGNLIEFSERMA
ncbi:hypothetical protein BH23ACT3_BH23ACT3_14770 [soil metagenome]